jgi:hypothetical protein
MFLAGIECGLLPTAQDPTKRLRSGSKPPMATPHQVNAATSALQNCASYKSHAFWLSGLHAIPASRVQKPEMSMFGVGVLPNCVEARCCLVVSIYRTAWTNQQCLR